MNVMVGLFCENVFAKALENEKELAAVNFEKRIGFLTQLADVFEEMDLDESHSISRSEFVDALQNNEAVAKYMVELELDDNVRLFDELDVDQTGHLTLKEFFNGTMLYMNGDEPCKVKDTIGTYLLAQATFQHVLAISKSLNVTPSPSPSIPSSPEKRTDPQPGSPGWLQDQFGKLHGSINAMSADFTAKVDKLTERQERLERLTIRIANSTGVNVQL